MTVDTWFAQSYQSALIGHGELFFAEQFWQIGGCVDDGRNTIAEHAIKNDYHYVFYMDTDMIFPRASLARLMRSQLDIVKNYPEHRETATVIGGVYNTRGDHRINVYDWKEEKKSFMVKEIELGVGVIKSDFVATGCQLVDVGVFESLKYPYFEYRYTDNGRWSEDSDFAKKCYDIGVPHFVDTDLVCSHIHECQIVQVTSKEYEIRKLDGGLYGIQDQPTFSKEDGTEKKRTDT